MFNELNYSCFVSEIVQLISIEKTDLNSYEEEAVWCGGLSEFVSTIDKSTFLAWRVGRLKLKGLSLPGIDLSGLLLLYYCPTPLCVYVSASNTGFSFKIHHPQNFHNFLLSSKHFDRINIFD